MRIEWHDELKIDDGAIDTDHKRAIDLVNKLLDLRDRCAGIDEVMATVEILLVHIREHFAREERFAAAIGFPGLDHHRHEHDALRMRLTYILQEIHSAHQGHFARAMNRTLKFLQSWMVTHILKDDMQLRQFYRARRDAGQLNDVTFV